jgi:uncharacterized protein YjbI with pentapeptide repeats
VITKEDYERLLPELEKLLDNHSRLRFFIKLENLSGFDTEALWKEIKFDYKHIDKSKYEILIWCLKKGDLKAWNNRRKSMKEAPILLEGADLTKANLNDADFWRANLKGTILVAAILNARTFIWSCEFDTQTDFTGVEVKRGRIDPRLREKLKNQGEEYES